MFAKPSLDVEALLAFHRATFGDARMDATDLSAAEAEEIRGMSPVELNTTLLNVESELAPLARHDKPTDAQTRRIDLLLAKRGMLTRELQRAKLNDVVRTGKTFVEGPNGEAELSDINFNRSTGGRPWEVRNWDSGDEVRGRALEVLISAGDESVERMKTVLDTHEDDPQGTLELARRVVAGSDPAYKRAFGKMLRDPVMGHSKFTSAEWAAWERSAMVVGTSANGGYMVPTYLDPTIILTNNGASAAMRSLARQIPLTSGNVWHGVSSTGVTVSFDPELTAISDDTPTVGQPSIPVYQAQGWVQYSVQAGDDIDTLTEEIGRLFDDAKDRIEEDKFSNGSGTAEPTGLWTKMIATGGSQLVSTTAATIGVVDIHALYRTLPARYRRRGSWLMNPVYSLAIKALGTAVSATFSGDLTAPPTGRILGLTVEESDSAPTLQTTTALDPEVIIGDFSRFVIVDRIGATAEFVPTVFDQATGRPNGSRGIYFRWRTGSDCVDTNGFRVLMDRTSA